LDWPIIINRSRWFVISSPPPICCHSFSFIGGIAKEYITKLGCEKYFLRDHILSTCGDALTENKKPYANSMIRTYPKYGTLAQLIPLLKQARHGEVADLTPAKFIWVF
jgi:hypothetical protein